jgi:hypothetical protein
LGGLRLQVSQGEEHVHQDGRIWSSRECVIEAIRRLPLRR